MTDPAYALQVALVTAMKSMGTTAGTRVYDTVPRAADGKVTVTFPFIALGSGDAFPIDEECEDRTDTTLVIDFWSRAVGFPEAKNGAAIIRAGLHEQTIPVTGHAIDRMRVERIDYLRDPDGLTSRARLTVSVQTTPV